MRISDWSSDVCSSDLQKDEPPVAPEVTAATWGRFFDDGEPLWALVAERDGMLVGFTHYLFHRNTNMIEPVCYLEDLFTAAAARGKGVGRALIESVCAERSEARRVGKECVRTGRHRWSTYL